MQVIPAVDVLDGAAVRLRRGDYGEVTRYGEDPFAVIRSWHDQGAELVHVVDLGGAKTGRPDEGLVEGLASVGVPYQLGGGIRTASAAEAVLAAGARRVVAGSVLLGDGAADFVTGVDAGRIVAALDVRDGRARGSGWLDDGLAFDAALARVVDLGIRTLLVTGIETDGMMVGSDLRLLEQAKEAAPGCFLIASGGVGSLADVRAVADLGADAVIVGRALYEGRFTLAEAIAAA